MLLVGKVIGLRLFVMKYDVVGCFICWIVMFCLLIFVCMIVVVLDCVVLLIVFVSGVRMF